MACADETSEDDEIGTSDSTVDLGLDPGDECAAPSSSALAAVRTTTAPVIDGFANDPAWQDCLPTFESSLEANLVYVPAGSLTEPSYPGFGSTVVTVQSVYTATDVYFLVRWADPTKSLARFPWQKQPDGTWKRLANKDSTGHENSYYEDKFAFQWNINTPGFEINGCNDACHVVMDETSPMFPGKKYNNVVGQNSDMWHWKTVRSDPNFQLDDKHVIGLLEMGNGRVADSKIAGGYKDNLNDNGVKAFDDIACPSAPFTEDPSLKQPCFMGPLGQETVVNDQFWIFDDQKKNFSDLFVPGQTVAGMITAPFVGSRGDVAARGQWADGMWTLEIRRSLTTTAGPLEDVQFDDLAKVYHFGVAAFDNTQINHAVHQKPIAFTFTP